MDVWGLTVAAFRRWYVLIPLLLLSLAAAFLIGARSQSEYEVSGAVMLVVPAENPYPSNPYAADSAVQILGIKASSSSTRRAFAAQGLSSQYEIVYDDDTPVMTFTVTGDNEETALRTGERLVAHLTTTLAQSQADYGIPRRSRVKVTTVDAPDVVNPAEGGTLRVTAMLALVGVVFSFAVAVVVDAILARRSALAEDGTGTVGAVTSPEETTDSELRGATRVGPTKSDP